jgi:hypothetical protein
MVAMGLLGAVMLFVAQLACDIVLERWRSTERQEALEAAANVLEAARACRWEDLSPDWASRQALPESLAGRLLNGQLRVRVEPEEARPRTRRITVQIHWSHGNGQPARPVELVGLRSARATGTPGGAL